MDVRDQVVDFVRRWSEKTEISVGRFPQRLGIGASKFYDWRERYGRVNGHNGWIPRDFWLEPWEKEAIHPETTLKPHWFISWLEALTISQAMGRVAVGMGCWLGVARMACCSPAGFGCRERIAAIMRVATSRSRVPSLFGSRYRRLRT
jgi:hypothetical protein